ncbi:MAG: hypothetical protein JRJ57_10115 [Deltaproteobacteria bacterium]|nr:hypothetical protein [Deltaproteobacteria bacterium]MBW2106518.1 hypothetical protein [Deltaproteobacteria bacterium]
MSEQTIGYIQVPKNSNGITRSKTTVLLRSWLLDRSLKQLEKINRNEWGKLEFPSIYVLFEKNKVYVGEAKCVYSRTKTHINSPDQKIKKWEQVLIINDGRPATQSDFNDIVVRRYLEDYVIKLFKQNNYRVVSQGSGQQLTSIQQTAVDNLIKELNFFLKKENLITKLLPDKGQEQVHRDDLKRLLEKMGKRIERWSATEAIIDGVKVFNRSGSPKKKGWQITFRDEFKDMLEKGQGVLLVPRGGILFIPFKEIQNVITDSSKFKQKTIDVYIDFKEDSIELVYTTNKIDVTQFRLIK